MKLSAETLMAEAEASGFRPEVLEKVVRLLELLNTLPRHPALNLHRPFSVRGLSQAAQCSGAPTPPAS